MRANLVGFGQERQGISPKNGKPYHFKPLYVTYKKHGVEGIVAKELTYGFLEMQEPHPVFTVGSSVDIDFDETGRMIGFEILTTPTTSTTPIPTKKATE